MPDNNDIRYSISPAYTPKDTRGTPASDLRVDPAAKIYAPAPNYGTGTATNSNPNLSGAHVPPSVLRDMLREAETEHEHNHRRRRKKLFWKLFWIFFAIYAVGAALLTLSGYESIQLGESAILIGATALMCVPAAAITAFFCRFIIITGYTRAFAGDAEELQYIEHLKDCMCGTSLCRQHEKGQA